jgi:C1A family cysteine protease
MKLIYFFIPIVCAFNKFDFVQYKMKYNKLYKNELDEYNSKIIYNENLSKINYFNQNNNNLKLEINQFGDLNLKTFNEKFLIKTPLSKLSLPKYKFNSDLKLQNIDWNELGYVRKVKQQANCGSCWAFSTIGALESYIHINYNLDYELSEQQLVDCSKENYGCNGGWMHTAMKFIINNNGIVKAEDYEYKGLKQICQIKNNIKETSNFKIGYINPNDLKSLQYAIYLNPICIAIDANQFEFMFYKDGIYDKPLEEKPQLNHAILLTGMNIDEKYWTIKNSWGIDWGNNGFMKIRIKEHTGVGGMNSYCILPLKK